MNKLANNRKKSNLNRQLPSYLRKPPTDARLYKIWQAKVAQFNVENNTNNDISIDSNSRATTARDSGIAVLQALGIENPSDNYNSRLIINRADRRKVSQEHDAQCYFIPVNLLTDDRLTPTASLCYGYMHSIGMIASQHANSNNKYLISQITDLLQISRQYIRASIDNLVALGYIGNGAIVHKDGKVSPFAIITENDIDEYRDTHTLASGYAPMRLYYKRLVQMARIRSMALIKCYGGIGKVNISIRALALQLGASISTMRRLLIYLINIGMAQLQYVADVGRKWLIKWLAPMPIRKNKPSGARAPPSETDGTQE